MGGHQKKNNYLVSVNCFHEKKKNRKIFLLGRKKIIVAVLNAINMQQKCKLNIDFQLIKAININHAKLRKIS